MNELLRYLELLIELKKTTHINDPIQKRINKVCDQVETVLLVDLKPDGSNKTIVLKLPADAINPENLNKRIRQAILEMNQLGRNGCGCQ